MRLRLAPKFPFGWPHLLSPGGRLHRPLNLGSTRPGGPLFRGGSRVAPGPSFVSDLGGGRRLRGGLHRHLFYPLSLSLPLCHKPRPSTKPPSLPLPFPLCCTRRQVIIAERSRSSTDSSTSSEASRSPLPSLVIFSLPFPSPWQLSKAKLLRAPSLLPDCVLPSELPRLRSPVSSRGSPGLLPAMFSLASFLGSIFPGHGWLRPWPGSPFSPATWTRLPTASICSFQCIASALPFSLVFSREGLNFKWPMSQRVPNPHLPLATFSLSLLHSISHPNSRCMEGGMNRAYVGEAPSKLP